MRSQQEAEKAEQQRIKKLVLNYDLRNESENHASPTLATRQTIDGEDPLSYILQPNPNHSSRILLRNYTLKPVKHKIAETESTFVGDAGSNGSIYTPQQNPANGQSAWSGADAKQQGSAKATGSRREKQQGARKLQLADMDWWA